MPHLILDCSANLADEDSIGKLCSELARCLDTLREGGERVFQTGAIRVRAWRCEQYCIADGRTDAAFLHANLKLGAGRSESAKKSTCDALFDVIKRHFADTFDERGLALSLEMNEFGEAGTLKHNNLHARLKG